MTIIRSYVLPATLKVVHIILFNRKKELIFVRLTTSQKQFLIKAAHQYASTVQKALPYLEERGISQQAISQFHLGVVEEPLPSHEQYLNRLSIPYITRTGVVDIRFRALNGEEPKYLGLPSAETTLFNVEALFKAKHYVCICEGEMDTITMASTTLHPTVGAPGATAWKKFYHRIFEDFDTIIVLADGDDAGMEFGKRIQRTLINTRILQMPEGEDVNSVIQRHGPQFINDKINAVLEL